MAAIFLVAAMFLVGYSPAYVQYAHAASVEPQRIPGNPTCSDLIDDPESTEFKLEPVSSGTFGDGTLEVEVTVYNTDQGQVFDFSSNLPVLGVVAKGGPNANFYDYGPDGTFSDTELHAPVNPNNNMFFGLSHISFCYVPANPDMELDKEADKDKALVGDTITYTFTLDNTGNVPITDPVVTDTHFGDLGAPDSGDVDSDGALDVDETWTWERTREVVAEDCGDLTNEAKASGKFQETTLERGPVSVTVFVACPDMELDKEADKDKALVGDTITYTFTLVNTGNVDIDNAVLTDSLVELGSPDSGDDVDPGVLNVGETWTWTRMYEVTEADCGDLINKATFKGEFQMKPIKVSDSATVFVACPDVEFEKNADKDKALVGDTITYTFTLDNTGNVDIDNAAASDTHFGDLGAPDSGDDVDPGVLNVGETWTWERTREVVAEDCETEYLTNEAKAMGEFQMKPIESNKASVTVFVACPDMELDKEADKDKALVGDTITYTFTLVNTGNVDIDNAAVNDDPLFGDLGAPDSGDDVDPGVLNVGETWTWTRMYEVTEADCGDLINKAKAMGEFQMKPIERKDSVTVFIECEFEGLTPGFWKANAEKFDAIAWEPTGFSPSDKFSDVFGVVINDNEDLTLLDALNLEGGGINALARHAVAALLNSAHPEITYPLSTAQVISMVADAINSGDAETIENLKDQLDEFNNLGGGIDQHGNPV